MKEFFVDLNGIETKITVFGAENLEEIVELIIVIPGNPGVNYLYHKFAKILYDNLNIAVVIIGHAGHNVSSKFSLPKNHEFYTLKGQIKHKIEFIKQQVPKNTKIHIVAHSIGTYILLEMLMDPYIKNVTSTAILLFPTIEHFSETKNGQHLLKYAKPFFWIAYLWEIFYSLIPNFLINFMFTSRLCPVRFTDFELPNLHHALKYRTSHRIKLMMNQSLDIIHERNNQAIRENLSKLHFFYGESDGWSPRNHYENLIKDIPEIQAELIKYKHAFYLKYSVEIADLVAEKIKKLK